MKKILLTVLSLCVLCVATAQTPKCGIDTKALMREEIAAGATTLGFLAQVTPDFDHMALEKAGIVVGSQAGNIVTLYVPVESLYVLEENKDIELYSIAHRIAQPMMDKTRADTRTDKVQAGEGVSDGQIYDGRGVYIGITDWGFDYTHPNYNHKTVDNWRVDMAWDHFRLAGPAPSELNYGPGLNYGTLIKGHQDLVRAKGDTSNLYGYGTHGTHVAGICAGRGATDGKFRGQAPYARLLLCSFGLGESQWLDGVNWMRQVAQDSARRIVVNSSWGMYSFSCLDGQSLLSRAINNLSDSGMVFVTSAGNNGDANFHISRNFSTNPDTLKTVATYYTYASDAIGQCLILWGEQGQDFWAGFRMKHGNTVWASPMFTTTATPDSTIIYDTLLCDTIRIPYRVLIEHDNPYDHRPHIQMDVDRHLSLQLQLFVTANGGTVHAWNVANKTNHAGNEGADFTTGNNEGFTAGDYYYGIGEPACAAKTISVAAHEADVWSAYDSAMAPGNITYFSSYGPALGGGQKPEISAPGWYVNSSISQWTTSNYTATATMNCAGYLYKWSEMSGTSMSSPAVTGIVALILQANPALTTDQVREILFSTARNDFRTGPLHERDSASVRWGWGKADALDAVNEALSLVSINEAETLRLPLHLYPNPTSGLVTVNTNCGERQQLQVYTIDGQRVMDIPVDTETTFDTRSWARGVYIVRVGSRTEKLIVR